MSDTILNSPAISSANASHNRLEKCIFLAALLFVAASSAYDGYLVVRTGDLICQFERNPVGRYLIQVNNGDPTIFLRVKAAGTLIALSALAVLHRRSRRLASPVEAALVVFQMGLLFYLEGPF